MYNNNKHNYLGVWRIKKMRINKSFMLLGILLAVLGLAATIIAAPQTEAKIEHKHCVAISGTGKNIGDEVACGSEHFYIVDNTDGTLKMLAKYNLDAGWMFKSMLLNNPTSSGAVGTGPTCRQVRASEEGYSWGSYTTNSNVCIYAARLKRDKVLQATSNSMGTGTDNQVNRTRQPIFYIYGTYGGMSGTKTNPDYPENTFLDYDMSAQEEMANIFANYESQLKESGFKIQDVKLMTLAEMGALVNKISNKKFPYSEWRDKENQAAQDVQSSYTGGSRSCQSNALCIYNLNLDSLDEYIPNDYAWLHDVSYWLGTTAREYQSYEGNMFFGVKNDNTMNLIGFQYGASYTHLFSHYGLRPLITIGENEIGETEEVADGEDDDFNYCIADGGLEFGSEVECNGEHFYVLEGDDNEVRMLAKYNLYTGVEIHKEKIEKAEDDNRTDEQYCSALAASKGGYVKSDGFYRAPGYCFYAVQIKTEKLLQNEKAKSAHWDEDLNYLYPQVGDFYIRGGLGIPWYGEKDETVTYEDDSYMDYVVKTYPGQIATNGIAEKIYEYRGNLMDMGYEIRKIDLLSVSEIDKIAEEKSGNRLPLAQWSNELRTGTGDHGGLPGDNGTTITDTTIFGDIKPYIPKEYDWLYSTTYWNKTMWDNYYMFVAQQGKLCGAGFQACAPETTLGCGIRPVITIARSDIKIKYNIKTKTDDNGSIEVVDSAIGGEQISFRLIARDGFHLKKISLITDDENSIEINENDLIETGDGAFSIRSGKFMMPFDNVLIEATWEKDDNPTPVSPSSNTTGAVNPNTGDSVPTILVLFGLSALSFLAGLIKNTRRRTN